MELTKKDISHNSKTGKKYNRKIYQCKKDDIWTLLEMPIKEKSA